MVKENNIKEKTMYRLKGNFLEMEMEIEKYEKKGYKILKEFPGEYVLMYNYENCSKVRIYENGKTWKYS